MYVDTTSAVNTTHENVNGTKYGTAYSLYFVMGFNKTGQSWAPLFISGAANQILKDGQGILKKLCYLQFPEFQKNLKIIVMIAIFAS